ncbi:unnamed protein product [Lepeophtheirus salmonis]|uniref:(salmon louse) hypothetical protein n=1 Tax=Lepeophtheirus salmonis TaxID=72036 RepID=A0A0K2V0G7_LEPSM|nr:unnamed protein product [Lepeophtheirus salmonis]CAF2877862.1 unnamed protein product [Lepeophtheirus salmonis]
MNCPKYSKKSRCKMDIQQEEFRKYLQGEGILKFLTSTLISLYEEHECPKDALEFVKSKMMEDQDSFRIIHELKETNPFLEEKLKKLTDLNKSLKSELESYRTNNKEC